MSTAAVKLAMRLTGMAAAGLVIEGSERASATRGASRPG